MRARRLHPPSILLAVAAFWLAVRPARGGEDSPGAHLPPPLHKPGEAPGAPPPPPPMGLRPRHPTSSPAPGSPPPPPAPASVGEPLAALLDRTLTPEQRAERAFLEHLGWRFVTSPTVTAITVTPGTPTQRPSLAAAQAAGDLRVELPVGVRAEDVARFASTLPDLADSIASRGGWQFLLVPAIARATGRLSENAKRGYLTFPQWLVMNAQVFSMTPPKSAWVKKGKIYQARERPSAAIEAFYNEVASIECYVAQSLVAYAVQYELYGPAWFDELFTPEEIAIGQVAHFHKTPLGRTMDTAPGYPWRALFLRQTDNEENWGIVLGRLGPLAFPGLSGILMDQGGASRSNQNFTFVSVTKEAADALVRRGGFPVIAEATAELLDRLESTRGPFVTGDELEANEAREKEIFADPILTGIRIYIHPYGVMTVGEMADRLRKRDRTAFGLYVYDESREDVLYQRYRRAWKARFAAGGRAMCPDEGS